MIGGAGEVAKYALDGLTARAEVRAHNIANSETPGYRARFVDFESSLIAAINGGSAPDAPAELQRGTWVDVTGNSVDLDVEITEMMADNLLFQAMVNAIDHKLSLTRTALGRSR